MGKNKRLKVISLKTINVLAMACLFAFSITVSGNNGSPESGRLQQKAAEAVENIFIDNMSWLIFKTESEIDDSGFHNGQCQNHGMDFEIQNGDLLNGIDDLKKEIKSCIKAAKTFSDSERSSERSKSWQKFKRKILPDTDPANPEAVKSKLAAEASRLNGSFFSESYQRVSETLLRNYRGDASHYVTVRPAVVYGSVSLKDENSPDTELGTAYEMVVAVPDNYRNSMRLARAFALEFHNAEELYAQAVSRCGKGSRCADNLAHSLLMLMDAASGNYIPLVINDHDDHYIRLNCRYQESDSNFRNMTQGNELDCKVAFYRDLDIPSDILQAYSKSQHHRWPAPVNAFSYIAYGKAKGINGNDLYQGMNINLMVISRLFGWPLMPGQYHAQSSIVFSMLQATPLKVKRSFADHVDYQNQMDRLQKIVDHHQACIKKNKDHTDSFERLIDEYTGLALEINHCE